MTLFSGSGFAHFATLSSGINLRHLPYFSLAFPQIAWGSFPPGGNPEIHRIISLAFHVACSLALYKLLHDLLLAARTPLAAQSEAAQGQARMLAFVGAAVFAIHPVAVYGAGYLIQRTVVLATLFSLLSMTYFVRGLSRGNHADAIFAALFYTLAVFSKEHSVLLPALALMMAPSLTQDWKVAMRYAGVYCLACLPAAVTALMLLRWLVGAAYEPHFGALVAEQSGIPELATTSGTWPVSVVTQSGLFFKYLAAWLAPDIAAMSIDMRIDFMQGGSPGWAALKLAAFAATGVLGFTLLFRGARGIRLAGFGLLYFWTLFAVEFSTVRFQEPFALYRSYLWAPGVLIALMAALSALPGKAVLVLFALAAPILFSQAHNRLQTFSSELALWSDAAAKLPDRAVPLGWRPLTNLAREQTYAGRIDQAIETVNRCLSQYPRASRCYFARGAIHNRSGEYEQALTNLDRAIAINPEFAAAHYQRAFALAKLGRIEQARAAYQDASRHGYFVANPVPAGSN